MEACSSSNCISLGKVFFFQFLFIIFITFIIFIIIICLTFLSFSVASLVRVYRAIFLFEIFCNFFFFFLFFTIHWDGSYRYKYFNIPPREKITKKNHKKTQKTREILKVLVFQFLPFSFQNQLIAVPKRFRCSTVINYHQIFPFFHLSF